MVNDLQLLPLLDNSASSPLDPTYQASISVCSQIGCGSYHCSSNYGMVRSQGRWFRRNLWSQANCFRKHKSLSLAFLHVVRHWILVNACLQHSRFLSICQDQPRTIHPASHPPSSRHSLRCHRNCHDFSYWSHLRPAPLKSSRYHRQVA
jgi:hypothetical protein